MCFICFLRWCGLEVGRQLGTVRQEVGGGDGQLGAAAVEGLQLLARRLGETLSRGVGLLDAIAVQRDLALQHGDYARSAMTVLGRLGTRREGEHLLDKAVAATD